jgi:subtilisin-like proprotein convertase family protein
LTQLETRALLATLPATAVSNLNQVVVDGGGFGDSQNDSTPSIAIDPNNPLYMAASWTINNPKLAPAPTEQIRAAVSTNGGKSWTPVFVGGLDIDPTTLGGTPAPYAQGTDSTVAFDHSDNLYLLYAQHNSGNTTGELDLTKYHAAGGSFSEVFANHKVDQWTGNTTLYAPTMTVDSGVKAGVGPQSDPFAGNIYVSWTAVTTAPKFLNPTFTSLTNVFLAESTDGGNTFCNPTVVPGGTIAGGVPDSFGASPSLAVAQGTTTGSVAPGTVAVLWDSVNQGTGLTPDSPDQLMSNRYSGGLTQVVAATGLTATPPQFFFPINGVPITPAIAGVNNGPETPGGATIAFNVNLPAGFVNLNDLSVQLGIVAGTDNALNIVLVPPTNSELPSVTLTDTGVNQFGQAFTPPFGPTGANFGISSTPGPTFGTVFDDNALLNIADGNAAAPYNGSYQPEALRDGTASLGSYNGATAAQLNGLWHVVITNWSTSNGSGTSPAYVESGALNFTSGFTASSSTGVFIANTSVRGNETNTGFPTTTAADPNGIGPDLTGAFDNTLGATSPNQGRLYATFVVKPFTGSPGPLVNQLDNTDIALAYSDNGGLSWTIASLKVNDDQGTTDGYSSASGDLQVPGSNVAPGTVGRPQFAPSVAVDNATGTLVMSWYDARNDAARSRVAVYMTTSIDGGGSYSPDVIASEQQTAYNAITGAVVSLGPIAEDLSAGVAPSFGTRIGLATYDGKAYPVWIGNEDAATINSNQFSLQVQTSIASFDTGPRVISSTVGPVSASNSITGGLTAADGTPELSQFQVVFDRPIPTGNFGVGNVQISYHDTTPGDPAQSITPQMVVPQNVNTLGTTTTFLVKFAAQSKVGTYSYTISGVKDGIETVTSAGVTTGNPMVAPYQVGGPNANQSEPLIIPGPTVASSDTQNASNNLAVNSKVSYVDVNFDRNMAALGTPGALLPADVLSIVGPQGSVLQPQTFTSTQIGQKATIGTGRVTSQISIPSNDSTFLISNLTITINLSSTRDGDLSLYLVGPDLTAIQLAANVGGNGQNFTGTTFADGALQSINAGTPPYTGTYSPAQPLATYIGKQLQGSWAIVVVDNNPKGTLPVVNGWSLTATPSVTVEPNPTPGANPDPTHPRSYRIGFPEQSLSGTYTVTLAPSITDANGNALDTNQNAGVNVVNGVVTNPSTVVPLIYSSTNVPQTISAGSNNVTSSTITIPDSYRAQALPGTTSISVGLSLTYPTDPDLTVELVAPPTDIDPSTGNPYVITLVQQGTGTSTGSEANFTNTVFNESSKTLVDSATAPFYGTFVPHAALDVLTANGGVWVTGTWTLKIIDNSTSNSPPTGTLNSWSLTIGKGTPTSGLGEPVADQATAGFRIFTLTPTNPQSQTTWTAVGPAGVGGLNGSTGPISSIAVDPSDPSGNTVYVTASSGGVWKTTNFLTTNPNGPTYVPLTDFGPTFALNIGSITVVGRNNNPADSIIVAGTGNANTVYGSNTGTSYGGNAGQGVGFLISTNGGSTWSLLDSTNNNLPFSQRDHLFAQSGGTATAKIVGDPHLLPNGQAILYAAMVGPNGGLWRSVDTGQTWQKLSTAAMGSATDVILDTTSATVDALTNPTGNVNTIWAAFPGSGVYISPNRGTVLNLLNSLPNVPQILDGYFVQRPPLVNDNVVSPTGQVGGRIVLAKPTPPPGAALQDKLYEGWVYAAVSNANGTLDGVYLTKDYGQTWTKLLLPDLPYSFFPEVVDPTNDNAPNIDPTTGGGGGAGPFAHSAYNLSLAVDPSNPNVVYLGGTENEWAGNMGLIRIDATAVYDTHSPVPYSTSQPSGGTLYSTTGRATIDPVFFSYPTSVDGSTFFGTGGPGFGFFGESLYVDLVYNPATPFAASSTTDIRGVNAVTNTGAGVNWTPFGQILGDSVTNLHQILSTVDPLTGQTRLIFATDEGVYTGVTTSTGNLITSVGTATVPTGFRDGNLQVAEDYSGAVQPTTALSAQVTSLIYGNTEATGQTSTPLNVLTTGNITSTGNVIGPEVDGTGVATDQQGQGTVYRFMWPQFGGEYADFFQVSTKGDTDFVGRTNGLIQGNRTLQWPLTNQTYANGTIQFGTFAVNPVSGNQVLISDATGQIFSTIDQGVSWLSIGQPSPNDYADALAYGAPDPNGPAGIGNLNNFLYAGTVGGKIFMTQTGGGSTAGNAWTSISNGLDGSAVVSIVPDPTRGSHAVYAVTQHGVYFMADSTAAGASWTNITNNLFSITTPVFGNTANATPQLQYLMTMQVDWRYAIPNSSGTGTHPLLYVAGQGGVFSSSDNGATWAVFPSMPGASSSVNGASANGGYLPNVEVTSLSLSVGAINPTTGYAVTTTGSPDLLVASTFGRGQFAIVVGPQVLTSTVGLDATMPSSLPDGSISTTNGGVDPTTGLPLAANSNPFITGISTTTGDGNVTRISLFDMSNPSKPKLIAGYNPSNSATDVAANWTDSSGRFHIQIPAGAFSSGGVETIGVQATDGAGTPGTIVTYQFVIGGAVTQTNQPPAVPTLTMNPADDTSGGLFYTSDASPHLIGSTDPGVTVQLYTSAGGNPVLAIGPAVNTNSAGQYSIQLSNLTDGSYTLQAVATNSFGSSTSAPFTFHVETHGPTTVPTLRLSPLDDTGILGDNVTAARQPHFLGVAAPNALVSLYEVSSTGLVEPGALATVQADASGNYTIQLPLNLYDGTISVEVGETDQAGNAGPYSKALSNLEIVSVPGDFVGPIASNGTTPAIATTTPALFQRSSNGGGTWIIQGMNNVTVSGLTLDIPLLGDFDGDGKADVAIYHPLTYTWSINRSSYGPETFTLGGPGTVPVVGVFASDGISDPASYSPTTGQWTILTASGTQTLTLSGPGFTPQAGDVPVPGNYTNNSNGIDQIAVYRASTGTFYIQTAPNVITTYTISTGVAGDIAVPGNYNDAVGVRQTDPAVYNPFTGVWQVLNLVNNQTQVYQFAPNDIPAPGDYTGSGRTQPVVYRWSAGAFISSTGATIATLGQSGDIPLTAPQFYRGQANLALDPGSNTGTPGGNTTANRQPVLDGQTAANTAVDVIMVGGGVVGQATTGARGNFHVQVSTGSNLPDGVYTFEAIAHGTESNPVVLTPTLSIKLVDATAGDYLGTGKTEIALYRRVNPNVAVWLVGGDPAINGMMFGTGAYDVPVSGDFNGSGQTSLALYRPMTGMWFDMTAASGYQGKLIATLGQPGDIPVPADYTGSGTTLPAVFRPSTGQFFVLGSSTPTVVVTPALPNDVPVPGNYDNTGKAEFAIYRPGIGSASSTWYIQGPNGVVRGIQFGQAGDIPVPGAYGGSATELAVWRPSTGQYLIYNAGGAPQTFQFAVGDIPMPGDYDGIGMTEPAVYRPGSTGTSLVWGPNDTAPRVLAQFGNPNDIPVLAPYTYRAIPASPAYAQPAAHTGAISLAAVTPATYIAPAASASTSTSASLDLGATASTLGKVTPKATSTVTPLTPAPSPVAKVALTVNTSKLQFLQGAEHNGNAKVSMASNLLQKLAHANVRIVHHK